MPIVDILNQAGMSGFHPRFQEMLDRRERREVILVQAIAEHGSFKLKRTFDKHEPGIQLRMHSSNWQGEKFILNILKHFTNLK